MCSEWRLVRFAQDTGVRCVKAPGPNKERKLPCARGAREILIPHLLLLIFLWSSCCHSHFLPSDVEPARAFASTHTSSGSHIHFSHFLPTKKWEMENAGECKFVTHSFDLTRTKSCSRQICKYACGARCLQDLELEETRETQKETKRLAHSSPTDLHNHIQWRKNSTDC